MSHETPTYPKGDLRRMLMVLGAIDSQPGITLVEIEKATSLARKTAFSLIQQAIEQAGVQIEKRGSGYRIKSFGPVFKRSGVNFPLQCALNAHTLK